MNADSNVDKDDDDDDEKQNDDEDEQALNLASCSLPVLTVVSMNPLPSVISPHNSGPLRAIGR